MGGLATAYGQAVTAHRQSVQRWENARRALAAAGPAAPDNPELVARLARLGADLADPRGVTAAPVPVRIGEATTLDGCFPVLLPLAGGTHLAVDADARDPRVGELLRAVVLRLLARTRPGAVRVVGIDTAAFGAAFLPLRPRLAAEVLAPTATTAAEVAAVLDEAERHARTAERAVGDDQELLLLVAASAPPPRELARLAALTHAGPAAAVCVLLAGYPPAGPGDPPPLGATTQLRLNERYALVGDPSGQPFSVDGAGLAAPVLLDGDPPADALAADRAVRPRGTRPEFEEYAALAREFSARQRGGERAAAEAERRRALEVAVDQLGQRLAAQGRRLDQLGRAIGAAPVGALAGDEAGTPVSPAPVAGGPSAVSPGTSSTPASGLSGTAVGVVEAARIRPGTGAVGSGGAAAAPGRPEVGAYPKVAVGETGRTPATRGSTTVAPTPLPAEVDPAAELAAARQFADETDRHGQQAEAIARRPALLPTWSPLTRALTVYTGFALVGTAVLTLLLGTASAAQAFDLSAVLAAACTGVPVGSFIAGHLVLGRWGRPVIGGGPPPSRFVPLGFVICGLLSPSLFCAYVLLFRFLG